MEGLQGQACAVYDETCAALTFVRSIDEVEGGRHGTVVDLDGEERAGVIYSGFEDEGVVPWGGLGVRTVVLKDAVRPLSTAGWFAGCDGLESLVGADRLDLSRCVSADMMLCGCSALRAVDVAGWDVGRLVSARGMFMNCGSLASIDVSGWDVRSLRDAASMFEGCGCLRALDVSRWDTQMIEDASDMFWGCCRLESLDVSHWDVSRLRYASGMFEGCVSLGRLDATRWDARAIVESDGMFEGCPAGEYVGRGRRGRADDGREER